MATEFDCKPHIGLLKEQGAHILALEQSLACCLFILHARKTKRIKRTVQSACELYLCFTSRRAQHSIGQKGYIHKLHHVHVSDFSTLKQSSESTQYTWNNIL